MISLKSTGTLAHIVIACQYDDTKIKYFNPDINLSNNFITKTFFEISTLLRGIDSFDTLSIIPK